ncbi:hypothetical protein LR48_Vigan347s001100 [Vigna angularis]|uniref:Retrotransposon gag domain-containing protein n=1 Tax=Phaseolus angularis TaxID=3914 RepID=A0A0L9T8S9_PHAAN|nr:hypothetical protein LR48_Vigan347s001100 [Vigna angularis]
MEGRLNALEGRMDSLETKVEEFIAEGELGIGEWDQIGKKEGSEEELPTFKGSDPLGWISKAEKFFDIQNVTEKERLMLTYICMKGGSSYWFRFWKKKTKNPSWEELREDASSLLPIVRSGSSPLSTVRPPRSPPSTVRPGRSPSSTVRPPCFPPSTIRPTRSPLSNVWSPSLSPIPPSLIYFPAPNRTSVHKSSPIMGSTCGHSQNTIFSILRVQCGHYLKQILSNGRGHVATTKKKSSPLVGCHVATSKKQILSNRSMTHGTHFPLGLNV